MLNKKKRRSLTQFYEKHDDYPVIFASSAANPKKKIYSIGHDLKIKEHDDFQTKKTLKRNEEFMLAKSINIGYYLITPLLLGVFFGYWLDKILNTKPLFLLTLFGLGIVGSFYNLWKTVNEMK